LLVFNCYCVVVVLGYTDFVVLSDGDVIDIYAYGLNTISCNLILFAKYTVLFCNDFYNVR